MTKIAVLDDWQEISQQSAAATFRDFYHQSIENVLAFLHGAPIRVLRPN